MTEEDEEFNRIEREAKQRMEAVSAALDKKAENARELGLDYEPAQQCKWPTCQSEEYQQALAEQIKRELVGEQPAQQEPVAWVCYGSNNKHDIDFFEDEIADLAVGTKLYTSPQPAQRKPLTPDDIQDIAYEGVANNWDWLRFARAIEAAHGIKENT